MNSFNATNLLSTVTIECQLKYSLEPYETWAATSLHTHEHIYDLRLGSSIPCVHSPILILSNVLRLHGNFYFIKLFWSVVRVL